MKKLSGSQIIMEVLTEQGVDTVFGYPGGQVINIFDAIYEYQDKIHHVLTAHEQGASHAADGYARSTGKVGVCIATSGPGATNLVTGIATAYLDSIPLVAITGNVPNSLIGKDSFQEVDIFGVTMPITKYNFFVKNVADLADTLREAFRIASSGRPGPVLVDIPKDVQVAQIDFENKPAAVKEKNPTVNKADIDKALKLIKEAEKPYIYVGGGAIVSQAGDEIAKLADKIDAVIGCSAMGLGAVSSDNPRFLGMKGMHGHFASSIAEDECDLIIVAGARFSDRATGDKTRFAKGAKIIHIDIDAAEIDKNIPVHAEINGDLKDVIKALTKSCEQMKHSAWMKRVAALKKEEKARTPKNSNPLTPQDIVKTIAKYTEADTCIATDVGQHQMWVAQEYPFRTPRTFISSCGLGTMGYGMGAAIGSAYGSGKPVVLVTGDGSFGMNLNEMATAVANNVPMVIVIMNNSVLGMVRQWQTLFFKKHYSNTNLDVRKTDFVKLAEAFGATGMRAKTKAEFDKCFKKAFAMGSPVIIDALIDKDEFVLPMLPPGGSVADIITSIEF